MIHDIANLFIVLTEKTGYLGIFILMIVESTFIPYPSELIIPPAGYLAQQGELNMLLIIFFGTLGSLVGASINYILSYTLGRKLVYFFAVQKWARLLLINEQKIKKAEDLFLKNAGWSTFIGRLIPGIRHLISIPAGFSRMNFVNFIFYTLSGAAIWVTILALLGYFFGAQETLVHQYYHELSLLLIAFGIIIFLYFIFRKRKRNNPDINKEN